MTTQIHFPKPGTFETLCRLPYQDPAITLSANADEITCEDCKAKLVSLYPMDELKKALNLPSGMRVIPVANVDELFSILEKMVGQNAEDEMHSTIENVKKMAAHIKRNANRHPEWSALDLYGTVVKRNLTTDFDTSEYSRLFAAALYCIAFEVLDLS